MVLVSVANAITENAGENAIVARIGGDQFMVVLPDCDTFSAISKAEKLHELIEKALALPGLQITASLGVAPLYPEDSYDTLFNRADMSMYAASAPDATA